jgi:hypothetical protein
MTIRYHCDACGADASGVAELLGWAELRALGPVDRPFSRQQTSHLCRLCYAKVQTILHPSTATAADLQLSEHSQSRDTEQ